MATTDAPVERNQQKLTGKLGVPAIIFMVVAASAPLTVIVSVYPIGFSAGNGVGFPAMFAGLAILLLLFAVGFTSMTRHIPRPGAFFTYIAHGLGRPWGLGAAYGAILCYMCIEFAVLAYFGYDVSVTLGQSFGVHIHWAIFTAIAILLVGWLGYRNIELSAKVLAVLLTVEVGISLAIALVAVVTGGAEGLGGASFTPSQFTSGAPALGLMFAAASFIGFEATAIFRDESRRPERTIPRATFGAVILLGVFYAFTCWGFVIAWGPSHVAKQAANDPNFLFTTASAELGAVGNAITHIFVITSIFAVCLAFHNIVTRYLHVLSGAGVMPGYLSKLGPKTGAPNKASLTTSAGAVVLIGISLAAGLKPYANTFTWFVGLGSTMYLILLAGCSLAVLVYFATHTRQGESPWAVFVCPALALIGLGVSVYVTVSNFPLLVGDVNAAGHPRFGGLSIGLLAAIVVVAAAGVIQAHVLRARRATAYTKIIDVDLAA